MLSGARITYLGHSTFRFITAGEEQIIIDPWLSDNPQTPEDQKHVEELDTILVTHGHFDDVIPLAQQTGATVVANFEISTYLMGKGIENVLPMQKGGTAQVGGIQVTATHATRLLGVRHVVPMHYGTTPFPVPLPGTPEEFQEHLSNIAPDAAVHVMKPGEDLAS